MRTAISRFRHVRGSIALLMAVAAACSDAPPPVVGISTSAPYVNAGLMALAEAEGEVGVDTAIQREGSNEAAPAIRTAERFVGIKGLVASVGHSNSAASLAAAPIYNAHRVVQLAPHSSATLYREAGPYSFRLVPGDDRQGAFLAARLAELVPTGGPVAVFYVNDDYGRGLRAALSASVAAPLTIAVELPHVEGPVSPGDLSGAAEALRATPPAVIVWLARASILVEYISTLREAAGGVPILGADATASLGAWDTTADHWADVRFVDFVDLDATDALRAFSSRYEARYGGVASGPDALTYDAVSLVLAGIASGADSGEELREFLLSLGRERPPFQGITGPIAFDERGEVDRAYVLRAVRRGPAR